MKELQVLGAGGGEVTGSHNLLTLNSGAQVVVDCGLYQGPNEDKTSTHEVLPYDPHDIKAVLVTHGHLDHIGGLPKLARKGLELPIYMTPETEQITTIALRNAEALDPRKFPYGSVDWVFKNIVPLPYGKKMQVDGARISFEDAGHILGSASAVIEECKGEIAVFSGDLGNSPSNTVKPTVPPKEASIVVMETTYGDRIHSTDDPKDHIKEALDIITKSKKGGTLLIPVFAIDRAQKLLRIFKEMKRSGIFPNIPVLLDSPMAIDITEIYEENKDSLNEELQEDQDPFRFSNLRMVRDSRESRKIKNHHGPKAVLAGSGMMNGGRIERHAMDFLPQDTTVVLFPGYSAKGTLSRRIAVEEANEVEICGTRVKIRAQIRRLNSLSAHADSSQLRRWIKNISEGQTRTRMYVLNHGEEAQRQAFAQNIINIKPGVDVILPANMQKIDLTSNGYRH